MRTAPPTLAATPAICHPATTPWPELVAADHTLTGETRATLLYAWQAGHLNPDTGHLEATARDLACHLDVSYTTISARLAEAVTAGLLTLTPGRGRTPHLYTAPGHVPPPRRLTSTVRAWLDAAARHHDIPGACRALLVLLAPRMGAARRLSTPQADLCHALDVSRFTVQTYIHRAIDVGLLARVVAGRPGVTAVYQGTISDGRRRSRRLWRHLKALWSCASQTPDPDEFVQPALPDEFEHVDLQPHLDMVDALARSIAHLQQQRHVDPIGHLDFRPSIRCGDITHGRRCHNEADGVLVFRCCEAPIALCLAHWTATCHQLDHAEDSEPQHLHCPACDSHWYARPLRANVEWSPL